MRAAGVALVCLFVALAAPVARAYESTPYVDPADLARLTDGQTVTYPQTLVRHGRRYVGGVTYTIVEASPDELTGLLADMSAYTEVLPHARRATPVGTRGRDQLVEIVQGNALAQAAYTLRIRVDGDRRRVRFWLDPSRPHGIDDAWGYFRVTPLPSGNDGSPRVLLTYGVLVDLGRGMVRDFFEARIQASMLTVPDRLRRYALSRFRPRARG